MLTAKLVWWTALALVVAPVASAEAQSVLERASLAGLAGVFLRVGPTDPDAEREGLTQSGLHKAVELRLRQAGIRVMTAGEWLEAPGGPHLDLHVTTQPTRRGDLYAYSIDLMLRQEATLVRNPAIVATSTTWFRGAVGTVGPASRLATWLHRRVREKVDEFINDYLTVNPKR